MYDFITVGGTTEDITFYTKEGHLVDYLKNGLKMKLIGFEYGQKMKIDKAHSTYGGGASNAAVCLSQLGFKVGAMVSVGDDLRATGIRDNFKKYKVDTVLIQKKKNSQTGFSFLLVGQGNEHVVFSNRAANTKLRVKNEELRMLKKSKWVYLTSLSGGWKSVLNGVFSVKEVKVAWNPGHIQIHAGFKAISKYLKKTEVLILNKSEAIKIVLSDPKYKDKTSRFLNNSKNLLRCLKSHGPNIVVVTDGRYGADAYDGENFYHQDILKERKRVDTTGVGDAFGSTFSAGLEIFKGDIQKAMQLGVKNTASVIGEQGAQNGLLTKRQILK